ncbi:hypothetical protein OHS18_27700 [Amycolatopsis sp. NBC_00355]|uniref:hypothetical protein n=1 Tax=Amycolatopsis sp. NBC_00355 TaxID=2975957 RepID=UPI002E26B628
MRDAILAAVEQNSGVPVWRGVAPVGELPVEPGSGRPSVNPPIERGGARLEVPAADRDAARQGERSAGPVAGRSEVRRHA